jgi:pimeloyl-ACP methyl ester carboxylesterase
VRHVVDPPGTPALVLLSAHCGGKNMVTLACRNGLLARDRLDEFTARAKASAPNELMLLPGWWYVSTAASFLDLASGPDILELAPQVRCPVLYVRGDQEPRDLYPAEDFRDRCGGPCTVVDVPRCGHFYAGREAEVTEIVCRWLERI